MKRLIAAILAICMLALLVVAVPPASAGHPEGDTGVLLSVMTMSYNPPDWNYWKGTINGALKGTVAFWELPAVIDGDLEYFHESFLITTNKGTLEGEDWGVYNLVTGDFWAHGTVLEATDAWEGLVGYTMFEWGVTTEPFVIPMVAKNIPVVLVPSDPTPVGDPEVVVTMNDMAFGDWGYWRGDVSGDLTGTAAIYLDLENSYVTDGKEYFFENSVFETRQGTILGVDRGVFDLSTGNFWGVGLVTSASGKWHAMEGFAYVTFGTVAFGDIMTTDGPFVFLDI